MSHAVDAPASDDRPTAADSGNGRVRAVSSGLVLLALLLIARVLEIQWWRHTEFARRADRIQSWSEPVAARPGAILDRTGRVLAASTVTQSLYLDPARVTDPQEIADRLASILPIDSDNLVARFHAAADSRFLWVQRRLSPELVSAVRALGLPRDAYGFRGEFQRHYPQGTVAAHLLGLRDIDNIGRGGLEAAFHDALRGTPGRRTVERDARGYVVAVVEEESLPPQHGRDLQLTIDCRLQQRIEDRLSRLSSEFHPKSAVAIVMIPDSGEILALASLPTFDPANPRPADPAAWSNHALAAVFEPGSTIKPLIVAWAVDRGLLERDAVLHCGWGTYRMGRRVLHDHHAYGELSLTDVLVKSSNIGMAKIGERLTNAELHRACAAFGFGRRTGVPLPGELSGVLRPLAEWDGFSTGSIPMGQELSATPLQVITAYAALANGGRLVTPRLVRRSASSAESPDDARPPVISPVISEETARWIVTVPLREVVTRGTGQAATIEGFSVFGKTGTAQVPDPQTGGYSHERHITSFLCGAPASHPQVLVLVVAQEPQGPGVQYGGTVAAPVARDILELALVHLKIPPDLPSENPVSRTASDARPAQRHQ